MRLDWPIVEEWCCLTGSKYYCTFSRKQVEMFCVDRVGKAYSERETG